MTEDRAERLARQIRSACGGYNDDDEPVVVCVAQMRERISDLEAKLAAAEADAGRWREVRDRLWIRSQTSMAGGDPRPALEVIIGCAFMDQPPKSPGRGDELDAAIDAARGAK